MRRLSLAVALCVLLAAPAAAPADEAEGFRVPIRIPERGGWETTFVCGAMPLQHQGGGLVTAVALLFNVDTGPPRSDILKRYSVIMLGHGYTINPDKYCTGITVAGTGTGASDRTSMVRLPLTRPGESRPAVEFRYPRGCPWEGVETCRPPGAQVLRISGSSENGAACRRLSPFLGAAVRQWKVLVTKGKTQAVRPREVPQATVDRICGRDTPAAQRLERETLIRQRPPKPELKVTIAPSTNDRRTVMCFDVTVEPRQVGLEAEALFSGFDTFNPRQKQSFLGGRTAHYAWPMREYGKYFFSVQIGLEHHQHRGVLDAQHPPVAANCVG